MPNRFAIGPGSSGSFNLTVEEDDGVPSYSGVEIIQFENTEFAVSEPVAGTVKINALSAPAPDNDARILAWLLSSI